LPATGGPTTWRRVVATSAVGAAVTVTVTAVLGAVTVWPFGDDDESSGEPPLTAVVKQSAPFCAAFVVDGAPDEIPLIPKVHSFRGGHAKETTWASQLGARSANEVDLHVTLQGTTRRVVVLESLTVKLEATPEVDGDVFSSNCPQPIAVPVRAFKATLDPEVSIAPLRPARVSDFPYSISSTQPEVLHVVVNPGSCDCDWTLQLEWTSGDQTGTITIDDDGQPFRSASWRGRT